MRGDHARGGDASCEFAEFDGADAAAFAGVGMPHGLGDVPEEDGAGIGCEVGEAFGFWPEGVPALVVGAELAEAPGPGGKQPLGLALPPGEGEVEAGEGCEGGGVFAGGGEEVLGLLGEVGGGAEGEAGHDGAVDAGPAEGGQEGGGIGEFRAGIAIHFGEGGVAFGELGAACGLRRREEVGVRIDEAHHGVMVAGGWRRTGGVGPERMLSKVFEGAKRSIDTNGRCGAVSRHLHAWPICAIECVNRLCNARGFTALSEYWDRFWRERRSRRRFLGAATGAAAGAAGLALVGCGDDDDDEAATPTSAATATTGPAATPTPSDPYANAKRGGVLKVDSTGDPPTIDPYGNLSFLTKGFSAYVYSRLFRYNTGIGVKQADLRPVGDLAQSAEASPDGLTWTVKLRTDAKFHNVAPVNGRAVDTDDVKYSWGRATAETNTNRSQVAFVDSVQYPDKQTVVFKLKEPNAAFLDVLADANLVWIMPKEADGGFDPAKTAIGSGPWVLQSYTPSVGFKFTKNPAWHFKGFPLMDGVEIAIIPEYANRLAQFQAGNTDISGLNSEDLVNVKNALPKVQLYGEVSQLLSILYMDPNPDSPWNKDPRVRLAISMAMDRDALLDLAYNVKKLKAAGLAVSERWNNLIPAGMERFWLDPKSSAQGETAKYFKYDVAEAKKLLAAAGYPDGFSTVYQYTANRYGSAFNAVAEANIQYLNAIGIKTQTDVQDYSSKYITQTFTGNFTGIAFGYETPFPEGGSYPIRLFTDNPLNHSRIKDPELEDLARKQQRELDFEKRRELFYEIQRKNAAKMWYIPQNMGAGTGWTGYQEWVKNIGVQTVPGSYGAATEELPYFWLDKG